MIELYSEKSLVAGSCSIFDKSVLYTASPNKIFFFPFECQFDQIPALSYHLVLHLQVKCVKAVARQPNLIDF